MGEVVNFTNHSATVLSRLTTFVTSQTLYFSPGFPHVFIVCIVVNNKGITDYCGEKWAVMFRGRKGWWATTQG